MSMSTEEALDYMKGESKEVKEPEQKVETPSVETEVKETAKEEVNVDSPEDKAKESNDGEQKETIDKGSDEPEKKKPAAEKKPESNPEDTKTKRDYAFERLNRKNKKLKEDNGKKEARIKELEDTLKKYESLRAEDFKKQDGTTDYNAYTDWKFQERDMKAEVDGLKRAREQESMQYAVEYDKYVTEKCFSGKDLDDYNELVATKGRDFAEAIGEADPNNVVFGYLDSIQEYPIVIRELMTNPNKWLGKMFRSKDPVILKMNAAKIADEILEEYHKPKVEPTQTKPQMPVMGKQISSSGATAPEPKSLVSSMKSINDYLAKHKH